MSEFSLRPVAARLEELLQTTVLFAEDSMAAEASVAQLKGGQVLLLENVRFYKNEGSKKEEERLVMARKLASYGDVFVSDAFGTAHRNSATMTGIPDVMGHGAAGYLMKKEIDAFKMILQDPPRPLAAIVGGAKVSDKILLLENLLQKVDKLIIGGAMAYTFLKATGNKIGKSYCQEDEVVELAKKLLATAKANNVEVMLPLDRKFVVSLWSSSITPHTLLQYADPFCTLVLSLCQLISQIFATPNSPPRTLHLPRTAWTFRTDTWLSTLAPRRLKHTLRPLRNAKHACGMDPWAYSRWNATPREPLPLPEPWET